MENIERYMKEICYTKGELKELGVEYVLKCLLDFSNTLYEKNEIEDKTG